MTAASLTSIADARERLVAAAITLADAIAAAKPSVPTSLVPGDLLADFREADAELRSLSNAQRAPRRPATAVDAGQFSVSVGEDRATVVLANSSTRATLEPDHARGLAAALNATAEHIDQPREIRRRRDVDEYFREQEG